MMSELGFNLRTLAPIPFPVAETSGYGGVTSSLVPESMGFRSENLCSDSRLAPPSCVTLSW